MATTTTTRDQVVWRMDAAHSLPYLAIIFHIRTVAQLLEHIRHLPNSCALVVCVVDGALYLQMQSDPQFSELRKESRLHWCCTQVDRLQMDWWHQLLSPDARLTLMHRVIVITRVHATPEERSCVAATLNRFTNVRSIFQVGLEGNVSDVFIGWSNILENLYDFAAVPVIDPLRGCARGVPGVVVATGPSLPGTLQVMAHLLPHAVIAACDSAMPMLLKENITPHFITCLERVEATRELIAPLPPLPHTVLVSTPVVRAATLAAYRGPRAFMPTDSSALQWLRDCELHAVGNTAATMAFALLAHAGCDPIYLIGQDLAFDRATHVSHAAGAHPLLLASGADAVRDAASDPANWVPGNNGAPILTSCVYRSMATSYRDVIARTGVRAINVIPADCGMAIAGAEWVAPEVAARAFAPTLPPPTAAQIAACLAADVQPSAERLRMLIADARAGCAELRSACDAHLAGYTPTLHWCEAGEREISRWLQQPVALGMLRPLLYIVTYPFIQATRDIVWNGQSREANTPALAQHFRQWIDALRAWIDRAAARLAELP